MKNRRRVIALVVIAVASVVVAGGLFASNMGFKLNYPLKAEDGGATSQTGRQCLGLPFNRQVGIDTAQDLLADTGAFRIEEFDPATDSNASYGGSGEPDFDLDTGSGWLVRVTSDSNYIAVGSHDPAFEMLFDADSQTGRTRYSPPYHGVAADAAALLAEIGAFRIEEFDPATDSNASYGGSGEPNFPIEPGNCYLVRVTSDINYIPAHY